MQAIIQGVHSGIAGALYPDRCRSDAVGSPCASDHADGHFYRFCDRERHWVVYQVLQARVTSAAMPVWSALRDAPPGVILTINTGRRLYTPINR